MSRVRAPRPLSALRRLAAAPAWLALLAALALPQAQAQGVVFGRLFTTPGERMQLDSQRDGNAAAAAGAGVPGAGGMLGAAGQPPIQDAQSQPAAPPPPPPEPVRLDGIVRRSSGRSTVWLNQVPQEDAHNQLTREQALSLRLSSGRKVIMKPGQSFDPASGSVQETPAQ
jgi:hypothetical protein